MHQLLRDHRDLPGLPHRGTICWARPGNRPSAVVVRADVTVGAPPSATRTYSPRGGDASVTEAPAGTSPSVTRRDDLPERHAPPASRRGLLCERVVGAPSSPIHADPLRASEASVPDAGAAAPSTVALKPTGSLQNPAGMAWAPSLPQPVQHLAQMLPVAPPSNQIAPTARRDPVVFPPPAAHLLAAHPHESAPLQ